MSTFSFEMEFSSQIAQANWFFGVQTECMQQLGDWSFKKWPQTDFHRPREHAKSGINFWDDENWRDVLIIFMKRHKLALRIHFYCYTSSAPKYGGQTTKIALKIWKYLCVKFVIWCTKLSRQTSARHLFLVCDTSFSIWYWFSKLSYAKEYKMLWENSMKCSHGSPYYLCAAIQISKIASIST